jgi:hypothetical protein
MPLRDTAVGCTVCVWPLAVEIVAQLEAVPERVRQVA